MNCPFGMNYSKLLTLIPMINIKSGKTSARRGQIHTLHGVIETPTFMPDATYGTVPYLTMQDLHDLGIKELVSTTLHLEQKIGSLYINKMGGLHKFIGWDRPILTDSGGWQVFSLIHRQHNKENIISNAGCSFKDYTTGAYHFLSPESSQLIQHLLGADIRIALDEPINIDDSLQTIKKSVQRNLDWAARSKKMFLQLNNLGTDDFNLPKKSEKGSKKLRPLLTAVVQGANNLEMRKICAAGLTEIGFDIYGFGGLPVYNDKHWKNDAPKGFYQELIAYVAGLLPKDKVRYGLGIGTPDDLLFAVENGWDIFDSVLPTRNARHGMLYVHQGQGDKAYKTYDALHIKSDRYKFSKEQIDKDCDCFTCKQITRSYLRYLIRNHNGTGYRLASIHNLRFYAQFMEKIRKEIS